MRHAIARTATERAESPGVSALWTNLDCFIDLCKRSCHNVQLSPPSGLNPPFPAGARCGATPGLAGSKPAASTQCPRLRLVWDVLGGTLPTFHRSLPPASPPGG